MLRTVGVVFGLVFLAGGLLADDPKTKAKSDAKKDSKETIATVVKVDVDKRTIKVKMPDGKLTDLTIDNDTKFVGSRGEVSDQGIKDTRVRPGMQIKLVMDGQSVKEVRLPNRNLRERRLGATKSPAPTDSKPPASTDSKEIKPVNKDKDDKKGASTKDK